MPGFIRRFFIKLRILFFRRRHNDEIGEELSLHIQLLEDGYREQGMSPEGARTAARRRFGNPRYIQECSHNLFAFRLLEDLLSDLNFAVRSLRKSPNFAITAVLTLALGIGTTTAIFSVADRLLFRSLPFSSEDRLVSIGILYPTVEQEFLFGAQYAQVREGLRSLEAWTSFTGTGDCDITSQTPRRVTCARVEASFIPTLGLDLARGRNFTVDEDRRNGPNLALISSRLWQNEFAGDENVLHRTIPIDGEPHEIIGVLGPDFELPTLASSADILLPQGFDDGFLRQLSSGPNPPLRVFGRLRPGVTPSVAQRELATLVREATGPDVGVRVRLVRDRQIGDAKIAAWILLAAVMAVLLIACANVANLLLSRAASRERELATRAALGAGRARLMRQALTESLLLGLIGGISGCGLAAALLRVFVLIPAEGIPRLKEASIDLRILAFSLALSLVSGLLFGLAPVLRLRSPRLLLGLQTITPSRHLLKGTLVVAQIAASLVLLTGASLLFRSMWNLVQEPLWTETDNVLAAEISLGSAQYGEPRNSLTFFHELENRLNAIPDFARIAISDSLPPAGEVRSVRFEGPNKGSILFIVWRHVTPGYFNTLGIPILNGRAFLEEDRTSASTALIVNETLARRVFGRADVVGEHVEFGPRGEVVGVAADVQNRGPGMPADPEYYVVRKDPRREQWPSGLPSFYRRAFLIARTSVDPASAAETIRSQVAALDATVPVNIERMRDRLGRQTAPQQFIGALLGLFALISMLLSCVGLYGVTTFLVVERTPEFGVRMAIGATPADILGLALSSGARYTATGLVIGLAGSFVTTRVLDSMLYRVSARDPWMLAMAAGFLGFVSLVAAWTAAGKAVSLDPLIALRHE